MPKTYSVDIMSLKSVEALQDSIKEYKEQLISRTRLFAERLAQKGVEIAQLKIVELNAELTGELKNSIDYQKESDTRFGAIFVVVASSQHACFVEFGTGQRGEDIPYPYPLPDGVNWNYNDPASRTIKYNDKTGTYYWFYPGDDGKWHYTEGMPSRPFMYLTSIDLAKEVGEIAKEVFQ